MVNGFRQRKIMALLAGLVVISFSLTSCDSLRQKFTRHKKKGEEEQSIVPVLVPVEYPTLENNPKKNYQEHYSLIKAWYRDLWTDVEEKGSARHARYIIQEITEHIADMKKLVDTATQANLVRLGIYLSYYKVSLDDPWPMRNVSRIESDLRAFDRFLRNNLREDKIQGHFIKAN